MEIQHFQFLSFLSNGNLYVEEMCQDFIFLESIQNMDFYFINPDSSVRDVMHSRDLLMEKPELVFAFPEGHIVTPLITRLLTRWATGEANDVEDRLARLIILVDQVTVIRPVRF